MFEITLITVGKLKEKFYLNAASEYEKRLKGYCQFRLYELPETRLPDNPSHAEILNGLEKEADLISSKIPKGAWFCVMTQKENCFLLKLWRKNCPQLSYPEKAAPVF